MKLRLYPDENIEEDADDGKIYEEDDLVLCKMPDGSIRSCGFNVNSLFLREGKSPMMTINTLERNGEKQHSSSKKVSDMFKHFAVPAGVFYMQPQSTPYRSSDSYVNEEDLEDELYEKLIALASVNHVRQNRRSRKRSPTHDKHRGTKKRRE